MLIGRCGMDFMLSHLARVLFKKKSCPFSMSAG
jgi:hypothetical protein